MDRTPSGGQYARLHVGNVTRMPIATQDALHALFHPRAVAVIGASDDTTKHGYIVLTNVRNTGFRVGFTGSAGG